MRRALAILLVAALAGGCSSTSSTLQGTQPRTLDRLNWSERNHRVLNQLMVEHGRGGKDWDPIFSAGDSDGDYEMLTGFPGMKLSLIWNRVKGGDIGSLSRQAVAEQDVPAPRFILQGRNENAGVTLPGQESILLGEAQPRLLAP